MEHSYALYVDGDAAGDEIYSVLTSVVVEEHADLPSAIQLTLPIAADGSGDITRINDSAFRPYANLAVVVTPSGGDPECIFDGYVLSQKIRVDRGLTTSTLQVWGQDASWMMNRVETVQEWADMDEVTIAENIFGNYQIQAADQNSQEQAVTHTTSGHTLMQRASDIQFLKQLARRNGRLCRVVSGSQPGQLTGYFAKPNLDGDPAATLTLNDPAQSMLNALEIEWDVTRPTEVDASQALFTDSDSVGASEQTTDPGLTLLGARGLVDFLGTVPSPPDQPMTVLLTAVVDAADELQARTTSVLRESAFFVRCTGELELASLGTVLRVNSVVQVEGVGAVHSGRYYVWSVRHTIAQDGHRMKFVLVRNATGSPPSSPEGPLAGSS
jgi:hypothetical protein